MDGSSAWVLAANPSHSVRSRGTGRKETLQWCSRGRPGEMKSAVMSRAGSDAVSPSAPARLPLPPCCRPSRPPILELPASRPRNRRGPLAERSRHPGRNETNVFTECSDPWTIHCKSTPEFPRPPPLALLRALAPAPLVWPGEHIGQHSHPQIIWAVAPRHGAACQVEQPLRLFVSHPPHPHPNPNPLPPGGTVGFVFSSAS